MWPAKRIGQERYGPSAGLAYALIDPAMKLYGLRPKLRQIAFSALAKPTNFHEFLDKLALRGHLLRHHTQNIDYRGVICFESRYESGLRLPKSRMQICLTYPGSTFASFGNQELHRQSRQLHKGLDWHGNSLPAFTEIPAPLTTTNLLVACISNPSAANCANSSLLQGREASMGGGYEVLFFDFVVRGDIAAAGRPRGNFFRVILLLDMAGTSRE